MINIEDACELMFQSCGYKERPFITDITDIGYGYAMMCSWNPDELTIGDGVAVVHKVTGEVKCYCYPHIMDEIRNGIDIKVPEKYAYKKS